MPLNTRNMETIHDKDLARLQELREQEEPIQQEIQAILRKYWKPHPGCDESCEHCGYICPHCGRS